MRVCLRVRVVADSLMIEESLLLQNKSGLPNIHITWHMCMHSTHTGEAREKAKVCESQEQINMQLTPEEPETLQVWTYLIVGLYLSYSWPYKLNSADPKEVFSEHSHALWTWGGPSN